MLFSFPILYVKRVMIKINPNVLIIKHSKIEQFLKIIGIALHTKLLKYRHLIRYFIKMLFWRFFWGGGGPKPRNLESNKRTTCLCCLSGLLRYRGAYIPW